MQLMCKQQLPRYQIVSNIGRFRTYLVQWSQPKQQGLLCQLGLPLRMKQHQEFRQFLIRLPDTLSFDLVISYEDLKYYLSMKGTAS
jgi:hypothetical protein